MSIKFGEPVIRMYWRILNLVIASTSTECDSAQNIIDEIKFDDFPYNRQFAKLKRHQSSHYTVMRTQYILVHVVY